MSSNKILIKARAASVSMSLAVKIFEIPPKHDKPLIKKDASYESANNPWGYDLNHKGHSKDPRCNDWRNHKKNSKGSKRG